MKIKETRKRKSIIISTICVACILIVSCIVLSIITDVSKTRSKTNLSDNYSNGSINENPEQVETPLPNVNITVNRSSTFDDNQSVFYTRALPIIHIKSSEDTTVDILFKYNVDWGLGSDDQYSVKLEKDKVFTETIKWNLGNSIQQLVYISVRDHSTNKELDSVLIGFLGGSDPVPDVFIPDIEFDDFLSEPSAESLLSEEEVKSILTGKWESDDHKHFITFKDNSYTYTTAMHYSKINKDTLMGAEGTYSIDPKICHINMTVTSQIYNKYGRTCSTPIRIAYRYEDNNLVLFWDEITLHKS